tara:strand:- start:337 stop:2355 length:2019 start_codon:yes stop_codon:yes gene_type:complete
MYSADADVKQIVDVARGLEGLRRQDGIHAAAVVITKDPLTDYLPIQRKPESGQEPEDAPIVTQYDMHGVEDLGLLKMDFLGLRNLDVITDTLILIKSTRDLDLDIDKVELDDKKTFQMLSRGESIGVFQLESGPIRSLMRSLHPTSFDDVAALVALYRPGPMAANMHNDFADRKNGRKSVTYFHEDAESLLSDTYGLMIYQESVMRVAQKFAGYSLAQADNLRKACGKKDRALMKKEKEGFLAGCSKTGYDASLAEDLFEIIEQFADYAFNKSHSYGYGFVAYQTAFLKANYPVEYLAALLTSVKSNLDRAATYLNECRLLGIEVTVPDVNLAHSAFAPIPNLSQNGEKGKIVFGLSAVRNVGEGLVGLIVEERDTNGKFEDFYDFLERCDTSVLNKRTVESLIKAGAFDSFGHPRQGLLEVHEELISLTVSRRREHDMGVLSLFGDSEGGPVFDERPEIPDIEFEKAQKLTFEKEMLGLYVSDHPLKGYENALARKTDSKIIELRELEDGGFVTAGGVVTNLSKRWTRRGDLMATFDLEDLSSSIEVMVFPKSMTEHGHKLLDDSVLLVKGRLDSREDSPKLICSELETFETSSADLGQSIQVALPLEKVNEHTISEIKQLLSNYPGDVNVFFRLGDRQLLRLTDDFSVDPSNGLIAELRILLGVDSVSFI